MQKLEREEIIAAFLEVQDAICAALFEKDGTAWREDRWDYAAGSGGGISRIWEGSPLFEKAGVNFSAIEGPSLPPAANDRFGLPPNTPFLATGVSLVIHPWNPFVPTIHMNIRYFEAGERWWFGGGVDLTPYYPVLEEIVSFHRRLKEICDAHGQDYRIHKRACDEYFFLKHRGETRGVGGLFFDHLTGAGRPLFEFVRQLGRGFPGLYIPFIDAHRDRGYSEAQRDFQLWRRSRYVEFNLLLDRGTLFGLQSGGRVESILMSMPALARWRYDWRPLPGTPEAEAVNDYLKPRDWLGLES